MLVSGEIVTGTHWPEAVEIIKCQPLSDGFYLVESRGLETNQYYQLLLEGDRLKQVGLKPKRLEQRMGRIHRIVQKNDVFVINLVASNTREGDVLNRLLTKMEQMRKDLGYEMVYDFIGDRLEEKQVDLHSLMQRAIMERESLNELMDQFEETISEEYQSLIELAKQEQLAADTIDLPGLKRNQDKVIARKVPPRVYFNFIVSTLEQHRVRTYESHNGKVMRVEREV